MHGRKHCFNVLQSNTAHTVLHTWHTPTLSTTNYYYYVYPYSITFKLDQYNVWLLKQYNVHDIIAQNRTAKFITVLQQVTCRIAASQQYLTFEEVIYTLPHHFDLSDNHRLASQ